MKTESRSIQIITRIAIFIFAAGILFSSCVFIAQRPARLAVKRIQSANHDELLSACRKLISERNEFANEAQDVRADSESVLISSSSSTFSNAVPTAIQNLQPQYLIIYEDRVMIIVASPPRILVLGFIEGAKQWGTVKLIDGLWIWTGSEPNTENG